MLTALGGRCHQHFEEFVCHGVLPKCDPVTQQVIHPCREMCWDLKEACLQTWLSMATKLVPKYDNKWLNRLSSDWSRMRFCDYFPSLHDNITCFNKPVTCDSPPDVTNNTKIIKDTPKDVYQLHDVVQYACINETFQLKALAPSHACTVENGPTLHPHV